MPHVARLLELEPDRKSTEVSTAGVVFAKCVHISSGTLAAAVYTNKTPRQSRGLPSVQCQRPCCCTVQSTDSLGSACAARAAAMYMDPAPLWHRCTGAAVCSVCTTGRYVRRPNWELHRMRPAKSVDQIVISVGIKLLATICWRGHYDVH
jgi:hypothetical protein